MTDVRQLYLDTAGVAIAAWDDPVVAEAWEQDSALEGMTVGALVAHAARALVTVRRYLTGDAPGHGARPLDAAGYLLAVNPDSSPDTEANRAVRARAEQGAAPGHAAVLRRAADDLQVLTTTLPHLREGHTVVVLDGVVMKLDDYLATRILELVVHHDDLGVSLPGLTARELPDDADAVAVGVLAEVARRRSSTAAMVATLARRERAPDEVPRAL